ncbi:MAG TPA: DUF429 domain-containing protein [Aldersonia sp.]
MKTVGVDLAAEPARTAMAVLQWDAGIAVLTDLQVGVGDDAIVAAARDATRIGIDSPFGWPDAFVDFVARHHAGHPPAVELATKDHRRPLTKRHTDLVVADRTGLMPLSVSADLIAHVALRCAGLLGQLAAAGVDVGRVNGTTVEVYPAAGCKLWGLPHKNKKDPTVRADAVAALRNAAPWLDLTKYSNLLTSHHDAFDAVVAALLARAVAIGATFPPDGAEHAVAEREGWVHVPTVPLSALTHIVVANSSSSAVTRSGLPS